MPSAFLILVGIILTVIAIALLYALNKRLNALLASSSSSNPPSAHHTLSSSCSLPNCVRCRLYAQKSQALMLALQEQADGFAKKYDVPEGALDRILTSLDHKNNPSKKKNNRIEDEKRNPLQNPNVLFIRDLPSEPFLEHMFQSWVHEIQQTLEAKENFRTIQQEYGVLKSELNKIGKDSWLRNSTDSGSWTVVHLFNQGVRQLPICALCPKTTALIENLPGFLRGCAFGNAFFSRLSPHTSVSAHCGPTNARIRCHLSLVIPPGCSIRVGRESRRWKEGKCLLFDDSYEHEVSYENPQDTRNRVVLIVDLWHPMLSSHEKKFIEEFFRFEGVVN